MTLTMRKLSLISIGILLIMLYYLNSTYIFNFFDSGFPLLIKRYYNNLIFILDDPMATSNRILYNPRIISAILFVVVLGALHTLFVYIWTGHTAAAQLFLGHIVVVSLLILVLYALHTLFPVSGKLYYLSRLLKDYLQSPIALILFLVLWYYYHKRRLAN